MCDLGYTMNLVLVIHAKAAEHILHTLDRPHETHCCGTLVEVRSSRPNVRMVKSEQNVADFAHHSQSGGDREACRGPLAGSSKGVTMYTQLSGKRATRVVDRAPESVVTSRTNAIEWCRTDLREDVDRQDSHFGH